jgi:hypothetical protein
MRRIARTWRSKRNLGLILTAHRAAGVPFCRNGRQGCHSWDCRLVLTAAGAAATSFLHRGADIQTRSTCISHGYKCWEGKTLDAMRKRKMMRRRKKLMNELWFFYPRQMCFIYKYTLMGLCRGKVQSISTGFYILPRADDKEASTYQEKKYVKKKRENIYQEPHRTSSWTRGLTS